MRVVKRAQEPTATETTLTIPAGLEGWQDMYEISNHSVSAIGGW
jgi:hypothetical protein